MKIAVLISNGSEEIEVLTPVDVLRRANVECHLISVCEKQVVGSHNIKITSDYLLDEVCLSSYDGIVIPGGMPGAEIISKSKKVINAITDMMKNNKLVASICASPAVVLARHNLLQNKKATCYMADDFINLMKDNFILEDVVVDGNLITANGPKSAMLFSLKICEFLGVKPKF